MSLRIEEMLLESDLDLAEMGDVVDLLAPLDGLSDAVPAPSAELADLFEGTRSGAPVSTLTGRRRGAVAGAVVLALSAVGATGLSAAANTLPRPLQHGVSQFSRHYLPFDLPEPPPPARAPQGLDALPPSSPSIEAGRAGQPTSRSTPGRDPALAPDTTGRPAPEQAQQPAAGPSASPGYSAYAAGPSASPYAQPAPSEQPSPSEGTGGRPASSPSAQPDDQQSDQPGDQKPGKGGKGGHDGKGHKPGPGPSDPGGQGVPAPAPGGQDPAPTAPEPVPVIPIPSLPLPDPLPDLGGTRDPGTVDPGADAG